MGFLNQSWKKTADFWEVLTFSRKMALISLSVILVSVTGALFLWASKANYAKLAGNLTSEDSTQIIRYLRDRKIPFKVDETGSEILIPNGHVYDLRLELASKGLAQTGVVGYEIFDNQKFGTTSTVQRINKQRATEGELVRTINHIKGVNRSRVHLAIPKKSAFLDDGKKPTASVVLDLIFGFEPTDLQIRGIQNLVSSAVQSLEPNAVSIIATNGKQLSKNLRDPAALFAAATMDYQRKYEQKLEKSVEEILSRVIGNGKVIVKVSADLDFSRVSETQTLFDGDNATPRSVNKDEDSLTGSRPLPAGRSGVRTQVPGADGELTTQENTQESLVENQTSRSRNTTNFEVPQTTRVSEKPVASLKRLSVAVMIDGFASGDAPVDDEGRALANAGMVWRPEKIAELQSIVANAVGWKGGRDPVIQIKPMKFFKEDLAEATEIAREQEKQYAMMIIAGWIAVGLLFTLFFVFVVRPFIKWMTENTMDNVEDFLPQTLEELEKAQSSNLPGMEGLLPEMEEKLDPMKIKGEMIREKIVTLVAEDPRKAAQIIHEWVHEKNVKLDVNRKNAEA